MAFNIASVKSESTLVWSVLLALVAGRGAGGIGRGGIGRGGVKPVATGLSCRGDCSRTTLTGFGFFGKSQEKSPMM